jgi:hypothetical protein
MATTKQELTAKVRHAYVTHAWIPVGKVQRYADNKVMGYYQVMEQAQLSIYDILPGETA